MGRRKRNKKKKNIAIECIDLTTSSEVDIAELENQEKASISSLANAGEQKLSLQEVSDNTQVLMTDFEHVDHNLETGETIPMSDVVKEVKAELSNQEHVKETSTIGNEQNQSIQKPKTDIWKRILITFVVTLAVILVAGYGFYHYEYSRLQKVDREAYNDENVKTLVESDVYSKETQDAAKAMQEQTADLEETAVNAAEGEVFKDSSVYNILLIGTDDRTDNFSEDARGDSCMLLSINKNTGKVHLLSFERGIGVPILDGYYAGQWDWLTHTFRYGGAELMTAEIRENFKVDVNHYVRVNIRTLMELIDAIGGIDVAVNEAEAEHINHPEGTYTKGYITGMHVEDQMQVLHPGINHLNGATATVYARTRALDDDWHRVRRQRRIIMAAATRLSKLSATEMVIALNDLIPYVQTNLSELDIANLLTLAPRFMDAKVEQMTIPKKHTYGVMRGMDGRDMFALDFDYNAKLIRSILYEIPLEELGIDETDNNVSSTIQKNSGSSKRASSTPSVQQPVEADQQVQIDPAQADVETAIDPATGLPVAPTTDPNVVVTTDQGAVVTPETITPATVPVEDTTTGTLTVPESTVTTTPDPAVAAPQPTESVAPVTVTPETTDTAPTGMAN